MNGTGLLKVRIHTKEKEVIAMLEKTKRVFCFVLVCAMLLHSTPALALSVEEESPADFGIAPTITAPEVNIEVEPPPPAFGREPAAPDIGRSYNNESCYSIDSFIEELLDIVVEDIFDGDPFFYLEPCEQIFSEATLEDDFEDSSVIVVLDRTASRISSLENRSFSARDFQDVGAIYVEDLDRLSDRENTYAQQLWEAERRVHVLEYALHMYNTSARMQEMLSAEMQEVLSTEMQEVFSAEMQESLYQYEIARQAGEDNTLVNFDRFSRILLIRLDQNCRENVLRVIEQLQQREYISWVGPNYRSESASIRPNDPFFQLPPTHTNHQWNIDRIDLPRAWAITTGSSAIRVGIPGMGIDARHPDLCARPNAHLPLPSNSCFCGRVSALPCGSFEEVNSSTWYGTGRAGIIGAIGNNGIGIAGIAWDVELVSTGVGGGWAPDGNWVVGNIYGIYTAREAGIPILSRSVNLSSGNRALFNAVANFNGLLINAAGNGLGPEGGQNTDLHLLRPYRLADLPNVIIVGASDRQDRIRWYSHFGRETVHLFAPSGVITTTPMHLGDPFIAYDETSARYTVYTGTSAAAPHVAGVAALIMSLNPTLTAAEVKDIILSSVDPIPAFRDISVSGGRLNAYTAVRNTPLPVHFDDVPSTSWAYGYIQSVVRNGIMVGTRDRIFSPNGQLDRASFAVMLGRIYAADGGIITGFSHNFSDVRNDRWYTDSVAWANTRGIIQGIGGNQFAPTQDITRAQLATMLFRYETYRNGRPTFSFAAFNAFPDSQSVPSSARDGMAWAVDQGIITGIRVGTGYELRPIVSVTRAEAAAMMHRYIHRTGQSALLGGSANISLNPATNHTFPAATVGYGTQAARGVTVSSTGNRATDHLTVTLSGPNQGSFQLNTVTAGMHATVESLSAGGNASFTVRPRTGLPVGEHRATVTVSGANVASRSFTVSFTVNPVTAQQAVTFNPQGGVWTRPDTNLTVAENMTRMIARTGTYEQTLWYGGDDWVLWDGHHWAESHFQIGRAGYRFAGWWTAPSGGTRITQTTPVSNEAARTLHAQWIPAQTVTFNPHGGVWARQYSNVTNIGNMTRTITRPGNYEQAIWHDNDTWILYDNLHAWDNYRLSRAGYTFAGWWTAASGGTQITHTTPVSHEAARTLHARWIPMQTVTFNPQNGVWTRQGTEPTFTENLTRTISRVGNYGQAIFALNDTWILGGNYEISRAGYTFAGWWTAISGGTRVTGATPVSNEATRTLYARWTPTSTLTITRNGGTLTSEATSDIVNVTSNIAWDEPTSDVSWLTISNVTPDNRTGNGSFRITATANNTGADRTGTIRVTGGGITRELSVTQAATASLTLSRNVWEFSTSNVASSVDISVTSNTTWDVATSDASWLTVSSIIPASRTGNGSFRIHVTPNTGAERRGTITVTGDGVTPQEVTVIQPAPHLTIEQSGGILASDATSDTVNVTSNTVWGAPTSDASWLTVSNITPAHRIGDGSFRINAEANTGAARTGTITVTGGGITQQLTVMQAAEEATLTLTPRRGGALVPGATFEIVDVTSNTTWDMPTSDANWLTISEMTPRTGNGSFWITATANNTGAERTGIITVTGGGITQQLSVTQTSRTFEIARSGGTLASGATFDIVNVTSDTAWSTPTSNVGWLTVSEITPANRTGDGSFRINATANTGAARSGTITVTGGGITRQLTVLQAAGIHLTVGRENGGILGSDATFDTIIVTSNMTWQVSSSNTSWLLVTHVAPANRTGNGSFRVNATTNLGERRTGTITVSAGGITRHVSVVQEAGEATLTIAQNGGILEPGATFDTVNVTSNIRWDVPTSNVGWLTISDMTPSNRTGNGSFRINATSNPGAERTGTITVRGYGITRQLSVTQAEGAATLTIERNGGMLGSDATFDTVAVTSNATWDVPTSNVDWLTITDISPVNRSGNGSFRINVTTNTGAERTGTITVTGGGLTQQLSVIQAETSIILINTWDGLRAAIDAAPANISTTIRISDDLTTTGAANSNAINIPANRIIVLESSEATTNRNVDMSTNSQRHFTINGQLTLGNHIALRGGHLSGGVQVDAGGRFTMLENSVIENCQRGLSFDGGAVTVVGRGTAETTRATFVMLGGTIRNNSARRGGGVNMQTNSLFEMSGGQIIGNTAFSGNGGGGVHLAGTARFYLNGTAQIGGTGSGEGNLGSLSANGGGVSVASGATVTMIGGSIVGNTAWSGGGVRVSSGTFTMSGGTIRDNRADSGGGVSIDGNGAQFVMDDATARIENNQATGTAATAGGGGISLSLTGSVNISAGEINSNTALRGGGVHVRRTAVNAFIMTGGALRNNSATAAAGDGGAIFAGASTLTTNPLPDNSLPMLDIRAGVVFSGNSAGGGQFTPPSNATTATRILAASSSVAGTSHPLNNYDINFRGTEILSAGTTFNNVSDDSYFYDVVQFALENDLMDGRTEANFAPDEPISRAIAVATLYRLAEEPDATFEQVFDDVSEDDWFGDAVVWAYQNAIIQRRDDAYFEPDEEITRAQFFMMLYRFAELMEHNVEIPASFDVDFSDIDFLSDWVAEELRWAIYKGLISDAEDEMLGTGVTVARAECAVILYRFTTMFESRIYA